MNTILATILVCCLLAGILISYLESEKNKKLKWFYVFLLIFFPSCIWVTLGESETLRCSRIEGENNKDRSKLFPEYITLNLFWDIRKSFMGGPAGEGIDFSNVRGNYLENQYGDLGRFKGVRYHEWTGQSEKCTIDSGCITQAYFLPKALNQIKLRSVLNKNKEELIPLPTEGDFLILRNKHEYGFYDCYNYKKYR